MNTIAKIASAGKADKNGNMNYGITKANYLGHGSNLVTTTNTLDMMKNMDRSYRRLNRQRSVFPSSQALLKTFYLSTFEATKKWTMPIRNWGKV